MTDNKGYLFLLGAAFVWAATVILLFQVFARMPYVGGLFQADSSSPAMVLVELTPDDPLALSGIELGQKVIAVEGASGALVELTGLEAMSWPTSNSHF
ncbi:MAG: hypothetical protein GY883_16030 [Shimia sp.]|nr:hypothetical protein [Shimia sp.]